MDISKDFPVKAVEFCEKQHYYRATQVTEEEFSQVAHRLYGVFSLASLNLEEITMVTNCVLLARLRQIDLQAPNLLEKIQEAATDVVV